MNFIEKADIYVTGSNSKMLSKDVLTEFRGRGDELRVYPLSFIEYCSSYNGSKQEAWNNFLLFGSLPKILSFNNNEDKKEYLVNLINLLYIKDVIDRNNIRNSRNFLDIILEVISSNVSSLMNSSKISNTFKSKYKENIKAITIDKYIQFFIDAFIIYKTNQFSIKGII